MSQINLVASFQNIRNYIAGREIGISRDRAIMEEVEKLIFCMIRTNEFSAASNIELAKEYREIFSTLQNGKTPLFDDGEEILLDPETIGFIHTELSDIDLTAANIDPLSDLYQTFIGSKVRNEEGQFFTPSVAIEWLVEAIDPKPNDKIIDPACGTGSFLSYSVKHMLGKHGRNADAFKNVYGIEKDEYLAKLARRHIAINSEGYSNIVCGDSIEYLDFEKKKISFPRENFFDIVLANPPFGSKIISGSDEAREQFDLAYKWVYEKIDDKYRRSNILKKNTPPQILFLELCIQMLKPGGKLGVVLPESMLSSSSGKYVSEFLLEKTKIKSVIGMPENLFKTSGKGGTHTKTLLITAEKMAANKQNNSIFMAEAKWCGHDSRGREIPHNDLPVILENFKKSNKGTPNTHLGYMLQQNEIRQSAIVPRYYDPEPSKQLDKLSKTHDLLKISDLIEQGVLELKTGDEVGKLAYGTGKIPFIRTSDISNWEIKIDPKHGVSEEIFAQYSKRQNVQEGDVFFVKDGTYLIGTCAFVSKYDTKILYQSHLYKIRSKDHNIISPYLLLASLSCEAVTSQIQSKRFTQDIIDSIGSRIKELVLPIPKDEKKRADIEDMVKKSIYDRIEAREFARLAIIKIIE